MSFFLPILALSIGFLLTAPVQAKPAEDLSAEIDRLCTSEVHLNNAKSALLSGGSTLPKQAARFLLICNELAIGRAKLAATTSNSGYMDQIRSARSQGLDTGGYELIRKLNAVSSNSALDRLYLERSQLINVYTR